MDYLKRKINWLIKYILDFIEEVQETQGKYYAYFLFILFLFFLVIFGMVFVITVLTLIMFVAIVIALNPFLWHALFLSLVFLSCFVIGRQIWHRKKLKKKLKN